MYRNRVMKLVDTCHYGIYISRGILIFGFYGVFQRTLYMRLFDFLENTHHFIFGFRKVYFFDTSCIFRNIAQNLYVHQI